MMSRSSRSDTTPTATKVPATFPGECQKLWFLDSPALLRLVGARVVTPEAEGEEVTTSVMVVSNCDTCVVSVFEGLESEGVCVRVLVATE